MIWLMLGCTEPERGRDDTGVGTQDACAEGPTLTWENFGSGFVTENCQSCHASTSLDRNEAPEDVNFDTLELVWSHAERILARAGAEPPTMPPMTGTTEEDRELLRAWLSCADVGT